MLVLAGGGPQLSQTVRLLNPPCAGSRSLLLLCLVFESIQALLLEERVKEPVAKED